MDALLIILQVLLAFALPPFLLGVVNRTKAKFAGRIGQPLLQPYFDIAKLLQKGSVFSDVTTWIFRTGPVIALGATALAIFVVPVGSNPGILAFSGDLIFLSYLLALARFFTVIAALDTGSAFEGMGGAREVTFACLAEPAFLLSLLALGRASRSLSLSAMLGPNLVGEWSTAGASLVLILVSLFIVLLAENSRIPFDDPNTHLELTMIHEVMVLDHSGPLFGAILYGASLKLFLISAIIARIAAPAPTGNPFLDLFVFALALVGIAILVGVVESVIARLRLVQVPNLLVGACILSSFGIVLLAR